MGYYEELLYESAYRSKWNNSDFVRIATVADTAAAAMKVVAGNPGWDGKSADAARDKLDVDGRKLSYSSRSIAEIARVVESANMLIDFARDAYEEIQGIALSPVDKAAVIAGGTVLLPGLGTIISAAGIVTAESALAAQREQEAQKAVKELASATQIIAQRITSSVKELWPGEGYQKPEAGSDVPPEYDYPDPLERGRTGGLETPGGGGPVFPGPGSTVPGITPPGGGGGGPGGGGGTGPGDGGGGPGGGGGTGPGDGGGGGGGGGTLPGDGIVWDPESPYYPGDTSADDGSGSGGGTTGGLGNGTGGVLGGIAGAGVAVGAAKLSTGGLGGGGVVLGGGNTPGGTGLKPAPASTTPTGTGGARGGMGMMGGAPAGSGSGEKKRPTTRGLIAPRLEDDEPFVQPKAGAGSRVPGDPLYEAAQAQRRAEEERNKPTPKKRWWHH